jgi:hypothetical protein
MVVQKFPEEPLPENKSLLNRQSKNALNQLKVPPDPYYLYSLQLGDAAIDKGLYLPRGSALQESVQLMYGWKLADAQRYIEQDEMGDPIELYPRTPGIPPDPKDLAGTILQEIEDKMSAPSASGYPPSIPDYLLKG